MKNFVQTFVWPALAGLLLTTTLWFGWQTRQQPQQAMELPSFANAVVSAKQSVVSITTSQIIYSQGQPLFGRRTLKKDQKTSLGSAVIVDSEGYLLTNHHVIKDADEIIVTLYDGRQTLAKVVGTDEESDLAVLWVGLNNLTPTRFGNPNTLRVGDIVLAIGNPFGFGHTVTQGIVSAMGRWGLDASKYENYIQTDADINVGNSGGALINVRGELVGINSAIFSRNGSAAGIGLAIPVDIAEHIMQELIQFGVVTRGWLGISVEELNISALKQRGVDIQNGVLVTNVAPGAPASQAGIQAGDIIVAIDNQELSNGRDGMLQVSMLKPGKRTRIDIIRDGDMIPLTAVVGKKPTT